LPAFHPFYLIFPVESEQICRPHANSESGEEEGLPQIGCACLKSDPAKLSLEANVPQVVGRSRAIFNVYV